MSHRLVILLGSAGLIAVLAFSARAEGTVAGKATVISGDTIVIDGKRIRILGIDAPELEQTCIRRGETSTWPCGQEAARALSEWITQYMVKCDTHGTDYNGRWQADCEVETISVATWIAGNGWAVPNRDCQCKAVRAWAAFAKEKGLGIWNSQFLLPWQWRALN